MERNVCDKQPTDAAQQPWRSKTSPSITPSQTLQSLISPMVSAGLNVTKTGGVLLSRPQSRHTQPQNHMLISSYQLHRLQISQLTLPYTQLFNRNALTRDGIGQGAQVCDPPGHFKQIPLYNVARQIHADYYYYYYYYYYGRRRRRISHISALAGKYSPILGITNQQD